MRPILVPEYLSEFQCIGGACEDTCCSGWNITIDKKMYQTYRNVKNKEIAVDLKKYVKRNRQQNSDVNYGKFDLDENKTCKMMLSDGLCSIHKELGEEFLCNTCAIYPRDLKRVGDIVEKSLSLSCPEAARIVLLKKEGIGFIETQEPRKSGGIISGVLLLEEYPDFWDIRVFVIQLLQSRQQPLHVRLIILGLFLQKVDQISEQGTMERLPNIAKMYLGILEDQEFINSLLNIEGNQAFQINLAKELIRYRISGGSPSKRYENILEQLLVGLELDETKDSFNIEKTILKYQDSAEKYYEPFMQEHEYMLENYVVNYVFKNLFPYDYKSKFESYMMLVIQYNLIKLHLIGMAAKQNQLNEKMVIECVQQIAKIIEHNPIYLQGVRYVMEENGFTTMGHMFVLIKH